jgi:hypothetical protein
MMEQAMILLARNDRTSAVLSTKAAEHPPLQLALRFQQNHAGLARIHPTPLTGFTLDNPPRKLLQ